MSFMNQSVLNLGPIVADIPILEPLAALTLVQGLPIVVKYQKLEQLEGLKNIQDREFQEVVIRVATVGARGEPKYDETDLNLDQLEQDLEAPNFLRS